MIVTVFRSRLNDNNRAAYYETADRIAELARKMPGYISHKGFIAEDGERVTIVEFADEASQGAWSKEAHHLEAKKKGRSSFYTEYDLKVCKLVRHSNFKAE